MACFHPLRAWRSSLVKSQTGGGALKVSRVRPAGFDAGSLEVPCGQCIGCRIDRSRQWAARCVLEASMYEDNCFVTLTYSREHIPEGGSLDPRPFALFMKRLRKRYGEGIRFYHAAEYGEQLQRPHHHALLFNHQFGDRLPFSKRDGVQVDTSYELEQLWPYGFATVGDATWETAAYVARYCLKKITGAPSAEHYGSKKPEFSTMSRRPGIGAPWFDRYWQDVFPSDRLVLRGGREVKTPRFFDGRMEKLDRMILRGVKEDRIRSQVEADLRNPEESLWFRREVREAVKRAQVGALKRGVENDP